MTKLVMALGGAGLAAFATMLTVALGGGGSSLERVGTFTPPSADISGPCDEAEHRNDPRCTGVAAAATTTTTTTRPSRTTTRPGPPG